MRHSMRMGWHSTTLEGELVRLEPLAHGHVEGLWQASRDSRVWRWLSIVQPQTREELEDYVDDALAHAAAGTEIPFATVRRSDRRILGSTRFLALRHEQRVDSEWPEVRANPFRRLGR